MNDSIKQQLIYEAKLEMARRNVWYYAKLKAPDFYLNDRLYLKDLCEQLQNFINFHKTVT